MNGQSVITKNKYIVISWFLVGFVGSQICFDYFNVPRLDIGSRIEFGITLGIGYIFYPLTALFLFATSTDSGNKEFMNQTIDILGMFGIIYILIPVAVEFVYNRMKK